MLRSAVVGSSSWVTAAFTGGIETAGTPGPIRAYVVVASLMPLILSAAQPLNVVAFAPIQSSTASRQSPFPSAPHLGTHSVPKTSGAGTRKSSPHAVPRSPRPPTLPDTNVHLAAVSCPSVTSCAAVGYYFDAKGTQQGLIETLSQGVWVPARAPMPSGARAAPGAYLGAIACPSASACFAVGEYSDANGNQQGLLETLSGGVWVPAAAPLPSGAKASPVASLVVVACPTATACVAVGRYTDQSSHQQGLLESFSGGAWTPTAAPLPTGVGAGPPVNLEAIACGAATACVAVGSYTDQNSQSQGLIETLSGGTWSATPAPVPTGGTGAQLTAVVCPAVNGCLAVGSYTDQTFNGQALIDAQSGGTWSATAAPLPSGANANPFAVLESVACSVAGACAAMGDYFGTYNGSGNAQEGLIETLSGGTWVATQALLPSNANTNSPSVQLLAIACTSSVACVGVGNYTDQNSFEQGLIETESGGAWSVIEAPVPSDAGASGHVRGLVSIACPSTTVCAAAGGYYDAAGNPQGLIDSLSGGSWTPERAPSPGAAQQPLIGGPVTSTEILGSTNCSCGNAGLGQSYAGEPVDTAYGNFTDTYKDFEIPGRGVPLQFTRTYNSLAAGTNGPLGYGWTFNDLMSLSQPGGTGPVTVTQEGGAQVVFAQNGSAYTPAEPRVAATLTQNGGTWTFVRRAQSTYTFSSAGQLVTEKDLNGYVTTLGYNGSSQLATITDPAGRTLSVGWTGTHITTVTDPNVSPNRVVTFQYNDGNGNLTDVLDVNGGHTHFIYNGSHQLTNIYDPNCYAAGATCNGGNGVVNGYDGQGRVTSQEDQLGRPTALVYVGDPSSASGGNTTVTDPKGNVTVDTYQYGVRTAETKGYGTPSAATWEYTYDPSTAAVASKVDPDNNTTLFTYDSNGNQLSSADELGRQTTSTYNSLNEPLTRTDGMNVTTSNTYDANGNLQSVSRPLLDSTRHVIATRTTQYRYGDPSHSGDVTSMIDPDNNTWTYSYDTYGDQISSADPLGDKATTTFNADGWKLTSVSPRGNVSGCNCASQYTTTYGYVDTITGKTNEFGDVAATTDPLGHVKANHYDADRNLTSTTDPNNNTTSFLFDLGNEQTVVTRADHTTLRNDYNLDGTVSDEKDGKGNAIATFGYDSLARLTSQTDALGNVTLFTYDGAGNELTKQDPGGNCGGAPPTSCTTMGYDAGNELTSITYTDGVTPNVSGITYDADGKRVSMTDGTGASTWAWDSLNRLTSFRDGHGDQVQYQYNLRGLVTQMTYPGALNVIRGYDDAGRWTSVQDWISNTTTFGYDPDSNLTTKTLPTGTSVVDTSVFNSAEQLASISDVKGTSTTLFSATYGRDSSGQVTADSSLPAAVNSDKYTTVNQLCYAGSNNTSSCSSPPTGSQSYSFDSAENLTSDNGTTQTFNVADELCWTVSGSSSNGCASAPTGATLYSYNLRGDRTTVAPPSGSATNLGYDQANRLTSWTQGSSTATYAYNGDGLRMSKTVSAVVNRFTWDVSGQLPLLIGDGTSNYIYGPGGLPLEQITSRPVISRVGTATASGKSLTLTITLPSGGRANDQVFVASTQPSTTTVTASTGYTSIASVTSGGSSPKATTVVFRHTVASGDTSVTLSYSTGTTAQSAVLVDYRGIDPSLPVDVSTTGSAAASKMVTAPSVTPSYANDQLLVFQGAVGTFSGSSWTAASGMTERAQVNSTANVSTGLADQALGAAGATGARVSTYGKSANLTTVMLAAPQQPTVLFYYADQLGSTRLLADAVGAVRGTVTYDPYGNVTASAGSYTTPLGFAGQYLDAETGFIYLRARYYDPTTAQLLTPDAAVAMTRSPYGYSVGNPINLMDPTGLMVASDGSPHTSPSSSGDPAYTTLSNTLNAVFAEEAALESNHGLSASQRSDIVGSIMGLMDTVWVQQGALAKPCSQAAQEIQASIADAATAEQTLVWQDAVANGPPVTSHDLHNASCAGEYMGGAFGLAGGASFIAEGTAIGLETTAAAVAGAVSLGIGTVGVIVGVWLIQSAAGGNC